MLSHYQIGLRTPVRSGAIRVGAVGGPATPMSTGDYEAQARQVFAALGKPYALVAFGAGTQPTSGYVYSKAFTTKAELDDAYGVATDNPSSLMKVPAAFIGMFDSETYKGTDTNDPLLESAHFDTPLPPKPEGNLGAIATIGLAGVAGLVIAGGKKKRGA